ncbi:hypothetical protein NKR23_g11199 [Pleurostoma richardsiae]|uniref:Uncharacterized protein n=1 Tax=Pleurostoma richardsiae TaxID=41990 RepID=A0AA38VH54_9PEZI|nr:hypothetical protein NKR23_g11199 [Pleurostoma richardsiae]
MPREHDPPRLAGVFTYVRFVLPWAGKHVAVWASVIGVCSWTRYSPEPSASCLTGVVHQNAGGSKEKGKGKPTNKRKRTHDDSHKDSDGNDGDDSRRPGNWYRHINEGERHRACRFACPFYKLDPQRYRCCGGKKYFRTFSQIKQHISRCHVLFPENDHRRNFHYCSDCWDEWKLNDEDLCNAHIREGTCQKIPGPERLSVDEYNRLDDIRGMVEENKWYEMWGIAFYGHEPPRTPYLETAIAEAVELVAPHYELELIQRLSSQLPQGIWRDGFTPQSFARESADSIRARLSTAPSRYRCSPIRGADTTEATDLQPRPRLPLDWNIGGQAISSTGETPGYLGSAPVLGDHQMRSGFQYQNDNPLLVFNSVASYNPLHPAGSSPQQGPGFVMNPGPSIDAYSGLFPAMSGTEYPVDWLADRGNMFELSDLDTSQHEFEASELYVGPGSPSDIFLSWVDRPGPTMERGYDEPHFGLENGGGHATGISESSPVTDSPSMLILRGGNSLHTEVPPDTSDDAPTSTSTL